MAKTVELQQASDLARASMEQRLQMYISNAEVLQDNLKAGAAEIDKGNEIIAGLQAEVRTLRDKVKTKSEVIRKQVCHLMLTSGFHFSLLVFLSLPEFSLWGLSISHIFYLFAANSTSTL